jgi:hypothetical protein
LFGLVEGLSFCIALKVASFMFDPFQDAGICIKRGWVSRDRTGDDLVPGSLTFLVHAE